MALNIGQLVGYVTLDTSGVRRGAAAAKSSLDGITHEIDQVGDATERAARKSSGQFGFMGKALKGLTIGLGAAGVAGGVMGIKTAAGMENADIAFTTMLGSAKKADKFLKGLADFAATTPFEFPELQTAASALISAGVKANKVIPIMTTLGNVTSGMGTGSEGIKRATIALQQMQAAGRITGEDLNQLRDAGIPVYDLLASATGKSKAEVVKLAQAGKLGKKELGAMMKALESGKGMERFSGLMEKQSRSLGGMWSTFMDTLNMKLAAAITPMIPLLKDGLGGATEFLAATLPPLTSAMLAVLRATVKTIGFFREHKGLAITLAVVIGTLTAVTAAHSAVLAVSAAGGMVAYLRGIKAIQMASQVWTAVQWALNAAMSANPIALVVIALAALVAGFIIAYKKSETFRNIVQGALSGVQKAAGAVVAFIKAKWPILLAILTGPVGVAVLVIAKHWDKIKAGASAVVDWIKGIPGKIGALGSRFGDAGRKLLQQFIDGMKNAAGIIRGIAGNIWDAVRGLLNGAISKINAALEFKIDLPLGKSISINPPNIPMLATGGRATGATLAVFGEGREAETVLPDSMLRGLLERVHASGREAGRAEGAGWNGPLIGQAVMAPDASVDEFAESLWFKWRTRG